MARLNFLPRQGHFFEDFIKLSGELRKGAHALQAMLAGSQPDMQKADVIKDIEHICDRLTHDIVVQLNRTFVTPLDREDIHALASSLDDVMDAIDDAAAGIRLYKIQQVRAGARRLVDIICDAVDLIAEGMAALERREGVLELAARISQLEHEADRVHQDAIVGLFDHEQDPIAVIKWKEIYDFLEAAVDRCEDVANVLESVMVKHG
jgi:predicted phosphate transport protein (TIGR00153 family)